MTTVDFTRGSAAGRTGQELVDRCRMVGSPSGDAAPHHRSVGVRPLAAVVVAVCVAAMILSTTQPQLFESRLIVRRVSVSRPRTEIHFEMFEWTVGRLDVGAGPGTMPDHPMESCELEAWPPLRMPRQAAA